MYTHEKCFERGERDIFNKIVARLYMGNLDLSRETTLPISDFVTRFFIQNLQEPTKSMNKISRTKQNADVWNGKGTSKPPRVKSQSPILLFPRQNSLRHFLKIKLFK